MLPRKTKRGAAALSRIRVYIGNNGMKGEKVEEHKNPRAKTITVLELCKALGWKG
jgi:ribosomal protein L13